MKKTAALAAFALAAMIPMGALGETVFAGEVTASNRRQRENRRPDCGR